MIADELLNLMNARSGHFRYESGHHGDLWLDLDRLYLRPRRLQPFVAELARQLSPHDIEMICGPMVGGAFIGEMVARELDVEFCWAERIISKDQVKYEIPTALRGTVRGRRVAIVDDAINAGSATGGALRDLKLCGANVVAIGALLILGDAIETLASDANIAVERIARRPNILMEPSTCRLCATGVPLEDLVPR
jgi:orotate phosphoribosyltransferase